MTGTIRAVCTSSIKGVKKEPVKEARLIEDFGIESDAHAGKWHRQVSLLSYERVEDFNKSGAGVKDGDFGENLLVCGIDFQSLPVGTRFRITAGKPEKEDTGRMTPDTAGTEPSEGQSPAPGPLLEMTQVGKACHNECAIKKRVGVCIMPTNGVFARVIRGGIVMPGDRIEVIPADPQRPFSAAVITLSDRASQGIYEDKSGPEAARILREAGMDVVETILIPDDPGKLKTELKRLADQRQVSLILTSGGTGFSGRDQTPEATMEVADRNAPGIAEAIRVRSLQVTDHAMLSRGASVIRGKTLIVNLPGSVKAVRESLGFIMKALPHGLGILRGSADN